MARIECAVIDKSIFPLFQKCEKKRDKSTTSEQLQVLSSPAAYGFGMALGYIEITSRDGKVDIDLEHLGRGVTIIDPQRSKRFDPHAARLSELGETVTLVNRKARKVVSLTKIG